MNKAGFFVKRQEDMMNHMVHRQISNNLIEVYRTNISIFIEKWVCWFFFTIGSGIYLKLDKYFIGNRVEINNWCEENPLQSLINKNINTFIINKGWCSCVGLFEIVYCLKNENEIANLSILPLFRGIESYQHTYDSFTKCMI